MSVREALRGQMERDLRLAILQLLALSGAGAEREMNSQTLRSALENIGHKPAAQAQREAVGWLEEQKLLLSVSLSQSMQLLRLTELGFDVAEGRATASGVARPVPGNAL